MHNAMHAILTWPLTGVLLFRIIQLSHWHPRTTAPVIPRGLDPGQATPPLAALLVAMLHPLSLSLVKYWASPPRRRQRQLKRAVIC
jgi:hypothetical protein